MRAKPPRSTTSKSFLRIEIGLTFFSVPTVGAVYDRPIFGGFAYLKIVGGHRPPLQWESNSFSPDFPHQPLFDHPDALHLSFSREPFIEPFIAKFVLE